MKHLKFMLAIVIMLFVVILVVENHETFSTSVLFRLDLFFIHLRSNEISLYYVIPITFLFGVLITGIYGIRERYKLSKQIKTLMINSREKDKELNSLRNLPITADDVVSGHLNNSFEE